jgi:hypothetical protein
VSDRPNLETANDPHPVEQEISIDVGGSPFRFVLIVPRYVYGKLRAEDWEQAGKQLRAERDRHIRNAVFAGYYFTVQGLEDVRARVRQSMCDLIYEQFTERQIAAGEEAWAVPNTLQRVG